MDDVADQVRLSVGGSDVLCASLVDAVESVCRTVETARRGVVVVQISDTGADAEPVPWPYDVDIHTVNKWERALRRFERLPAATLSVVDGPCRGPALDLVLTTDYRVASPAASFSVPVAGGGTWPGPALYRLVNQVGVARARPIALFGAELSADRAAEWGLVDALADDTDDRVVKAIGDLATVDGAEVAVRRQLLVEAASSRFEDALGVHLAACDRALRRIAD